MKKHEVKTLAREHGFDATYSGHRRAWTLRRIRPSTNTRAFDALVRANLARMIGGEVRYAGE